MNTTLAELGAALKSESPVTGDYSFYGVIEDIYLDEDENVYAYEVSIPGNQTVEARKLVGADIGDVVVCTTLSNGLTAVTGRLDGDKDAIIAIGIAEDVERRADEGEFDGDDGLTVVDMWYDYNMSTSQSSFVQASGYTWSSTIPDYVQGLYIWRRLTLKYNDNTTEVEDPEFDSNNQAQAEINATAEATNQHFWYDNNGAHVATVADDEDGSYNSVWNSNGLLFRYLANVLMSITTSAISMFNTAGKKLMQLATNSLQFFDGTDEVNPVALFSGILTRIGKETESNITMSGSNLKGQYNSVPTFEIKTEGVVDTSGSYGLVGPTGQSIQRCPALSYVYTGESITVDILDPSTRVVLYTDTWVKGTSKTTICTTADVQIIYDGDISWMAERISDISSITYQIRFAFPMHIPQSKYTFGFRGVGDEGLYSFAIGEANIASGDFSFASGEDNEVIADHSYALGEANYVRSKWSFAEGFNNQISYNANYSHAEGQYSSASGSRAHAEGYGTSAIGDCSHTQNEWTYATHKAQTVIGTYNAGDTTPSTAVHPSGSTDYGNYAFIIGNGTSTSASSNCFTVDWNGKTTLEGHDSPIGTVITATQTSNRASSTDLANLSSAYIDVPAGSWIITLELSGDLNSSNKRMQFEFYNSTDSTEYTSTRCTLHTSNTGALAGQTTLVVRIEDTKRFYCRCYQNSGSTISLSARFRAMRIA